MNNSGYWKNWAGIAVAVVVAIPVWADVPVQWKMTPGWEAEGAYCRLYDARTVVTLKGSVERVEDITPLPGMGTGVHLVLHTDAETVPVHLGPAWYAKAQPVQIHAGDIVEVTGSRVPCDGKPVIMAAQIKRGNEVAKYRKISGRPLWSGVPH
jgi:hypothetical protein